MEQSEELNIIIDAIAEMAALNFSRRIITPNATPQLKVITTSLNMLNEALEHTVVSKFQLEESEKRLRVLFEQASEAMIVLENNRIKDSNSKACQLLQLEREQVNNFSIQDFFPEMQESGVSSVLYWEQKIQSLGQNESIRFPINLHRLSGEESITAEFSITRIDLFHHVLYQCIVQDISQRHNLEQKLHRLLEQFKSLFEIAPNAIAFLSLEAKIIVTNPAFNQLMGQSEEALRGKSLLSLLRGDHQMEAQQEFYALLRGDQSVCKFETAFEKASGERIQVLCTAKLKTGQHGRPDSILAQFTDVTPLKMAQVEAAQQLERSQKVNKELGQFAHLVSHDLKAPLRGIVTLTQFIEEDIKAGRPWEQVQESLSLLRNRALRMDNLINGLLTYARIGREAVLSEEIPMDRFLQEVIDLLEIPSHVKITLPTFLPTVEAPKIALQQIFQNLIVNAYKYCDKPACIIQIAYEKQEGEHLFQVIDNGPGIPAIYQEKVFEIFQTLYPRDQIESTGIGLSIVRKHAESLGGRIQITDSSDQGTTFSLWLPY